MAMSSQFNVVSLFSGCGGSSLGYQMAGGKVLFAVEWDNNAVETYKLNFPDTDIYHGDIAKLSVNEILERTGLKPGELDILDGSPPCQGFSTAGKRIVEDPRNSLFKEYIRILRGLKPKVLVMENVSGMVKGKMKLVFAEILRELKLSGYVVKARLMNTMYYGVPQSRQRMIFIGVRNDLSINPSHPKPQSRPVPSLIIEGIDPSKKPTLNELGVSIWIKAKPGEIFSKYHPKGHWFNSVKLNPNKPSPTISKTVMECGASGIYHFDYPRVLTINELKKLASYPDDFQFIGKFKEQWARIGNSVPPLFMKAIAEHIRDNILSKIDGVGT